MLDHVSAVWPILTRYDQGCLQRVAMPLGGIGTGSVSLGGRGDLRDWEVVNRPAKGFTPLGPSRFGPGFALWARLPGEPPVTRALEGPLDAPYEAAFGLELPSHGLPRFRHSAFCAAYPLAQVLLEDAAVPLRVRLEAWNPLIPADAERSGLPVAILRFVLCNPGALPVEAAVCGSLINFIGTDGRGGRSIRNRNAFRAQDGLQGLLLHSEGVDPSDERWGTLALATTSREAVTHRRCWADVSWGDALLDFWDDFSTDGRLSDPDAQPGDAPLASLAVPALVPPLGECAVTFILAWHFPHRQSWSPREGADNRIGNHYTTVHRDAWEAAAAAQAPALEADTVRFVSAFCASDLPQAVKEAALNNLSTLRTQTCFRTEDGRFFGFEGCGNGEGCCHGSCTHVWNYEAATSLLFGELAQSMREVEFGHATDAQGRMSFRVHLPLARAQEFGKAAADGQMGTVMRLYRDWQLSGDAGLLHRLWPSARAALEFCWIDGGWDADRDGVMEGCQHNTLDVEYYGPNPLMAGWYLGALRAGQEMASQLGDAAFAARCRDLFDRGRAWVDAHLWNGEYYEQEIRPPLPAQAIAPGLRAGGDGPVPTDPQHQIGPGCLVDQLAGQYMAHVCGLGHLLDPEHVRSALSSILRHNFREDLFGHFNHLRSFAVADEQGLLMCTFPRGGRPRRPTPYYNELMTGFEYTAAVHMLFEGLTEEGLRCIRAIRARYDGRRRSPWNEAECGHHYARAMASWSAVLALTGFAWSGVTGTLTFAERPGRHFWSTGYAWGTCVQRETAEGLEVDLEVLHGRLPLRRLEIRGRGGVAVEGGGDRTVHALRVGG